MPVWCENILHVRGTKPAVSNWLDAVRSDKQDPDGYPLHFDFNRIVPYPRRLEPELAPSCQWGSPSVNSDENSALPVPTYWWCVKHWGTKWNASHSVVTLRRYGADVSFDTAWSAPFPVIFALLEQYPILAFSLHYRLEGKRRYRFIDLNYP